MAQKIYYSYKAIIIFIIIIANKYGQVRRKRE